MKRWRVSYTHLVLVATGKNQRRRFFHRLRRDFSGWRVVLFADLFSALLCSSPFVAPASRRLVLSVAEGLFALGSTDTHSSRATPRDVCALAPLRFSYVSPVVSRPQRALTPLQCSWHFVAPASRRLVLSVAEGLIAYLLPTASFFPFSYAFAVELVAAVFRRAPHGPPNRPFLLSICSTRARTTLSNAGAGAYCPCRLRIPRHALAALELVGVYQNEQLKTENRRNCSSATRPLQK
jgi:hypothetical protein